jgi:Tfp pilus assembly protein PilX
MLMQRLLRLLRRQDGISLVLAVGILGVLSLSGSTVVYFSSSNARSANHSKATSTAYDLAEAGVAHALSILSHALNPATGTLLPTTTLTLQGGTATYSGTLVGNVWTITSTGIVKNPTGASDVRRTITKTVQLSAIANGSNSSAWNRIYHDSTTSCLTIPAGVVIPSNIASRGNMCLNNSTITGAATNVAVGGTVTITAPSVSSGARNAGAGAGWTNSGNISANDNVKASTTVLPASQSADLNATNFGFSIPATATVTGVTVRVERNAGASSAVSDHTVQLLKNGVPVGNNKAVTGFWGTGDTYRTYGSSTDAWGAALTGPDVNSSTFGLRFRVQNALTSNLAANVDHVEITLSYLDASSGGIGSPTTPVERADIGSTCTLNAGTPRSPCTAADHVWATNVTNAPSGLKKPTVDFAYWFANAKPGPKQPCTHTYGTTPPVFDNESAATATYNGSNGDQELTPEGRDYMCHVKDGNGKILGELSWNRTNRTLTIKGTIFFDGGAFFHDHVSTPVHYTGRAMIYMAKGWHNDEAVCAGGAGAVENCRNNMSNWNPKVDLLILAIGDKEAAGHDDCSWHQDYSAFQGVVWAKNDCKLGDDTYSSGPIIADRVLIEGGGATPNFFPWPPLGQLMPGQVYGTTSEDGDYSLTPGTQSG